jgi:MFS family permease
MLCVVEMEMVKDRLIGKEFLFLCSITFLSLCNTAVFFNLFSHLNTLGFSTQEAGLLIGLYPLTSMVLYGSASRYISTQNAYSCMIAGILITIFCGISYQFVSTLLSFVLVRCASGVGIFLIMSSCMTLLISVIPPQRSGVAFSLFSVSMLLPYSIMPGITEYTELWFSTPTTMYMLAAFVLMPMLFFAGYRHFQTRKNGAEISPERISPPSPEALRRNLLRGPIFFILFLNGIYFFLFSSLFYFLKSYGSQLGITNPGYFFSIQMGIMVLLRLCCSRVVDIYVKEYLILFAFIVTGVGFGFLAAGPSGLSFFLISGFFGVGMGLCIPPLNSLLYLHAPHQYRGYNANMMLLTMHFGSFCGPFVGSWFIESGGYPLYCYGAISFTILASLVILYLKINHQPAILRI